MFDRVLNARLSYFRDFSTPSVSLSRASFRRALKRNDISVTTWCVLCAKSKQILTVRMTFSYSFLKNFNFSVWRNVCLTILFQKQPCSGVLRKRCSENMQQIYRRTLIPKYDFTKVVKQLYWNHTSAWVFSCKFNAYFQSTFSWD